VSPSLGLSCIHIRHDFYRDIEVTTPYPSRALWLDKQVTYLDTIGRPAIMFEYKDLTIKHVQNIYVSSIVVEFSNYISANLTGHLQTLLKRALQKALRCFNGFLWIVYLWVCCETD